MKKIKAYYRRNLPHIQPIGATFFVTFRLFNSIPYATLKPMKEAYKRRVLQIKGEGGPEKNKLLFEERTRYFYEFDDLMDKIKSGPFHLKKPEIAKMVERELHRFDGELYDLVCYSIMSNHVHILIDTSIQIPEGMADEAEAESFGLKPLDVIMKRIKGPTAVYANRLLGKKGKFWGRESFDRYIRDERDFDNVVNYILLNPVKAGLVSTWSDWPFSFCKYE